MLLHQETLPTKLLNYLKKQEVCAINVHGDVNNFVLRLYAVRNFRGYHMENVLV
jgi:hypothetical protein